MPDIEVKGLCKNFKIQKRQIGFTGMVKSIFNRHYEIKKAVNDVSFSINKGEIVGYIGPNGAGKSTTIKILTGILAPDAGDVSVKGVIPCRQRKENARNIGVVFGQRTQLWWDIPVYESFNLLRYMYRIPLKEFKNTLDRFTGLLELDKFINQPVRTLSLGQRMRADIAAALIHKPSIIYLDEPTIGLDVIAKKNIREFIIEVNKTENTTFILTTHDMNDIEKLCSRVIVIDHGRIMYDGEFDKLKNIFAGNEKISIQLENGRQISFMDLNAALKDKGRIINNKPDNLEISYEKRLINPTEILKAVMIKNNVRDFVIHSPEIDEIISKMYLEFNKSKKEIV